MEILKLKSRGTTGAFIRCKFNRTVARDVHLDPELRIESVESVGGALLLRSSTVLGESD